MDQNQTQSEEQIDTSQEQVRFKECLTPDVYTEISSVNFSHFIAGDVITAGQSKQGEYDGWREGIISN